MIRSEEDELSMGILGNVSISGDVDWCEIFPKPEKPVMAGYLDDPFPLKMTDHEQRLIDKIREGSKVDIKPKTFIIPSRGNNKNVFDYLFPEPTPLEYVMNEIHKDVKEQIKKRYL